jgi:hypothetical protein
MERYRVYAITAKIEAVSGVDAAPVGANGVRTAGVPTLKLGYLEQGSRQDMQSGVLGTVDRAEPSGRYGEIEVVLEVKGAGAAYAAGVRPECDPFMRAAGFSATVDATGGAEKVTYTSLDEGMETMTLYCYTGRKLIKLIGCVATLKGGAEANKRAFLTFGIKGRVATDPTESALPAGLAFSSVNPPLFKGAYASVGAWDTASGNPLVLRKVAFDTQTADTDRPSAGAADGHAGYVITDRIVRQTMDVEVVPLGSFDPYAMSKAVPGALPAATSWQVGTAQYNRMKVATGRWALEAPTGPSDANGIATWGLAGNIVQGTAAVTNREINITFD